MKVQLTVQVPIYINMDCTVHCVSIGAQFISGTVANRFSTLRSLGQLHNIEAVDEFSLAFDNFLTYGILAVRKKLTEREMQI